ncbi:hypothetical protein CICLE_v10024100mg, partial [Citrus x clementina]
MMLLLDKVDWSTKTKTIFIHILHDHVKNSDLQTSTFTKKLILSLVGILFQIRSEHQKLFTLNILKEIFNTTTASGHLHFSSNQVSLFSDENRESEENFLKSWTIGTF